MLLCQLGVAVPAMANQLLKGSSVKLWKKILIMNCNARRVVWPVRGRAPIKPGYDHRYSFLCWQAIPQSSQGWREA